MTGRPHPAGRRPPRPSRSGRTAWRAMRCSRRWPASPTCRSAGCAAGSAPALAAGEMISADPRLWHTAKSRRRRDHTDEPEPRVVQIAGGDPEIDGRCRAAQRRRRRADHRHQHGLPGEEGLQQGRGLRAAARRSHGRARSSRPTVRAVDVPVTLKIRTGWAPDHRNARQHRAHRRSSPASGPWRCTVARARAGSTATPSTKRLLR